MLDSVTEFEREVELARAKLARDLGTLRSPTTFSSFTEDLKGEAFKAKEVVFQHARDAVHSSVNGFVEEVKAKAAANPAAALAIGAGIAWQLLRHPPIATILVGAGVFSLWRTPVLRIEGRQNKDYLDQGKQRLKQQLNEFGVEASKVAADAGRAVAEKAGQAYDSAAATVDGLSRDAAESAADIPARATAKAERIISAGRGIVSDAGDHAASLATRASQTAKPLAREIAMSLRDTASTDLFSAADTRDRILLGVAGLAVAGALGIAYQKRVATEAMPTDNVGVISE
jgi:hypothetical protein